MSPDDPTPDDAPLDDDPEVSGFMRASSWPGGGGLLGLASVGATGCTAHGIVKCPACEEEEKTRPRLG